MLITNKVTKNNPVRHQPSSRSRKISPFPDCSCFSLDPSHYVSL